jgi:hypothetical protein
MARWTTAPAKGHPLAQLDGKSVSKSTLKLQLGPKNRHGASYFRLSLLERGGTGSQPILLALHHSGPYPSFNWVEVTKLDRNVVLSHHKLTLSDSDIQRIFRYLSDLIPPGGHMMVEYESDQWTETRQGLACGIPPVATPLGGMMFNAGCGIAFKDWHFAEGGSEGPRKLQGYKALDEVHRRKRASEMSEELRSFLNSKPPLKCKNIWEQAKKRAKQILISLSTDSPANAAKATVKLG